MKILDVGAAYGYPCANIFDPWKPIVQVFDPKEPDDKQLSDVSLVIFGGGQDICPSIYGHMNVGSNCGQMPSARDQREMDLWSIIHNLHIPTLGICRGAQFLCVMTGGWLIQHVNNHAGPDHMVKLADDYAGDRSILTNSYHHQMMVPGAIALTLGYTDPIADNLVYDVKAAGLHNEAGIETNPEVVLFDRTTMGWQCHPEYMNSSLKLPTKVRGYVHNYFRIGDFT